MFFNYFYCSSLRDRGLVANFLLSESFADSLERIIRRKGYALLVLAHPTRPSGARALLQELCHWFCSQNLQFSSRIAFGRNCQMTCRGLNLDSNLNFSSWTSSDQRVAKVLSAPQSLKKVFVVWESSAESFPLNFPTSVQQDAQLSVDFPNPNC